MILSRNSWHFKLASSVFTDTMWDAGYTGRISLCSYFWLVVLAGIVNLAALACLAVAVICGVSIMVVAPIVWLFTGLAATQAGVGAIIWGVLASATFCHYLEKWWKNRNRSKPAPKQSNILVEYIKAKKSKVCPIMEVK